jgi:nitrite reductase/ring-hydroxylating ferredoxin subunit
MPVQHNFNGYKGYLYRGVPPEDSELTHSAPGTPCGEYLRRFWQPVALSAELKDLPVRTKIMHEELVVFRDRRGRVGVLQLHCSHRGASLEFGQIGEVGIRCCYHGWHYDIDGKILDIPGEPPGSQIKSRLSHGAYPAIDYKGLIWAYMGPPEKCPPFPLFDILETSEFDHSNAASKVLWPCNWLQIRDNVMDPLHTVVLHTISPEGTGFSEEMGILGEIDFLETPLGVIYVHSRRIDDNIWVRMSDGIEPNMHSFGLNAENGRSAHPFNGPEATVWVVPMDDENTLKFRIRHYRHWQKRTAQPPKLSFGQEENRPYEEQQRLPNDYDAQVSQRPIAIHALENLASGDRGIIMLRDRLRKGIEAVKKGDHPPSLLRSERVIIRTYCNDTVVRVPPARNLEEDKKLQRETGLRLAAQYIKNPPEQISCATG